MDKPRLILSSDLGTTGQDPRTLAKLCRKGSLERLRQGVYLKKEEWTTLTPRAKYGLKAEAFRHLAPVEPVFCYVTAGLLWGLWIVGTPSELHVRTLVTAGGQSRNGVRRRIGKETDAFVRCGQLLVTDKLTTTMALIDKFAFPYAVAVCDSSLRPRDSHRQVNSFLPPGQDSAAEALWDTDCPQGPPLTRERLFAAAMLLPSRAARERTLAVITFASALSGSAGESISRATIHQLGFPAPVLQKQFLLRDGSDAFVDFWFKELNLAGEFDGRAKYLRADWGGGSMQDRLWSEKQREDAIRAQDVRFVRWTWREATNRALLERLLREAGLRQTNTRRQK